MHLFNYLLTYLVGTRGIRSLVLSCHVLVLSLLTDETARAICVFFFYASRTLAKIAAILAL